MRIQTVRKSYSNVKVKSKNQEFNPDKCKINPAFRMLPFKDAWIFKKMSNINRKVVGAHVTTMAGSISDMGCIRNVVVAKIKFLTGKWEWYIIDGQHLYDALVRTKSDIPFVVIEIKNIKDLVSKIAKVNSTSKKWVLDDYITAWSQVKPDYMKLKEYITTYDIEAQSIVSVFMNCKYGTGSAIIKEGRFKIEKSTEQDAISKCQRINDAFNIIPRMDRWSNRTFVDVCLSVMNDQKYNHKKFMNYLTIHKKELRFVTQNKETLSSFLMKGIN